MQAILWIVGVYLAVCLLGFLFHRHFMYFPDPAQVPPAQAGLADVEELTLKSSDGTALVAWYAEAKPRRPTVLYFHGNAANAANRAAKIATMRADGTGVLYLNNRGYGGSEGSPSEAANVADALAAYDHLRGSGVAPEDIVVYGESLGSGQAVKVGALKPVKAVVLEAPLASTVEVGRRTWWFLPLGLILTDRYDNVRNVRDVTAPVLVLHGAQDAVIPVDHGRRVHDAASGPKRLELFPAGAHSDLFDHGAWERVKAFLQALPKPAALPSGGERPGRA
jgi:fermentation-respiration switch protein FrsA (DUF1100 family)